MSKHVLLVEDEPDLNETISFNLDSEGYEVASVFNGKEALKAIEKKKPDLILLDLMLPDMSGLEICRELRSSKKTKKIPIMMVTAKGEEVDRIVGFELGADDYIVKPFSIREFMLRVSAMLKRTDNKSDADEDLITFDSLEIDLAAHRVILDDKEILKRAVSVTENYDRFGEMAQDYTVKGKGDIDELKKQLYLAMVNVNLLEGLRFYVSFACTFAFGELKLMEGSAKILSLIARDEATHLNLSTHVIKAWQKGDDKGMSKVIKGLDKTVIGMFKKCVEEEKAWAKHLFKDGSIIGLNERLLGTYVEWIANKRLRALGFDPLYDVGASQNPLPWTQHWLSSKGLQVAPQETEVESYLIGGIKQDVKKGQFSKFKL